MDGLFKILGTGFLIKIVFELLQYLLLKYRRQFDVSISYKSLAFHAILSLSFFILAFLN